MGQSIVNRGSAPVRSDGPMGQAEMPPRDRDLTMCLGFQVDGPNGRIGTVIGIAYGSQSTPARRDRDPSRLVSSDRDRGASRGGDRRRFFDQTPDAQTRSAPASIHPDWPSAADCRANRREAPPPPPNAAPPERARSRAPNRNAGTRSIDDSFRDQGAPQRSMMAPAQVFRPSYGRAHSGGASHVVSTSRFGAAKAGLVSTRSRPLRSTVTPRHPHVKDERTSGTGPKERVILHATWWRESIAPRNHHPLAYRSMTFSRRAPAIDSEGSSNRHDPRTDTESGNDRKAPNGASRGRRMDGEPL